MAITYHAGKRLQATSTDFGTNGSGIPAVAGGWKEIGRTTLGSAANFLTVSSLPDKRYYMVLFDQVSRSGAANNDLIHFNTDTANNYARRYSANGGTDGTSVSRLGIELYGNSTNNAFYTGYIANLAGKEKLAQIQLNAGGSTGAGNASTRVEIVGKWANTSDAISEIKWKINNSTETFGTNSEIVVLGWDPADTHTTNFWTELASVTNSGGSTNNFGTGSFTAKKYLWVQAFVKNDGACSPRFRVGTGGTIDTGTNIASRSSSDGGADGTALSRDDMVISISSTSENHFINMFMVNNASNEKLAIHNCITVGTAGAGTAPQRREGVSKYSNTSAQVNIIELEDADASAGLGDGTIIKVWGSD